MNNSSIDERVIKAYFRNEITNELLADARNIFNKLQTKKNVLNSQGLAGDIIVENIMQEGIDRVIDSDVKSYGVWRCYVLNKLR